MRRRERGVAQRQGNDQLQRQLADRITSYAPVDELRSLILAGAKPNIAVTRGLTPLHYATWTNYVAAARLLLVRGAQADARDEVGCSALHLAAEHGHYRLVELLLQYLRSVEFERPLATCSRGFAMREFVDEPLRLAIKNGHYECARLLLEHGSDPNAAYFDGPEITQLSPHDTHFMKLLLEHGASPNVHDRKGVTPLMRAARATGPHAIDAAKLLLDHGADVNAKGTERQDERTALHFAVLSGSLDMVRYLIERGAEVEMPDDYEHPSPLDIAVIKDDPAAIKLLLSAGASASRVHSPIGSALHLACISQLQHQQEVIGLLLNAGADPNQVHRFKDGAVLKTPFVEYIRNRDEMDQAVIDTLLSHGARVILRTPLSDPRGQLRNILKLALNKTQHGVLAQLLALGEHIDTSAVQRMDKLPVLVKMCLLRMAKQPPTLQQAARLALRKAGVVTPQNVDELPLPLHLKRFTMGIL